MDISKYEAFFHDGSIHDISHIEDSVVLSMESAEMDKEDTIDNMILSRNDRISGKLHIEKIEKISENGLPLTGPLKMRYDDAEIFHFKLKQKEVELQIKWGSYPPNPEVDDFSTIVIEAEKVWWENVPNLESN